METKSKEELIEEIKDLNEGMNILIRDLKKLENKSSFLECLVNTFIGDKQIQELIEEL